MKVDEHIRFWGQIFLRDWPLIIAIGLVLCGLAFALIFLSWLVAFWLKTFCGYNPDLASCWQGVGAIAAAATSIAALGGLAWARDWVEGKYNTPQGVSRWDLQEQTQQPEVQHVEIAKEE